MMVDQYAWKSNEPSGRNSSAGDFQPKASTASAGGATGVAQAYHGSLVPPFCNAAARGYFAQF